ncbi:PAS domain S-box protein [Photobacterium sp. 53610]|uniref:PAS domain S-box protein n=1 Tax=Photobacterium sp. 53610 TaxID=3102789 RepID=UPI002EDB2FCE
MMSIRLKTILGIAFIEVLVLVLLVSNALTYLSQSNQSQLEQRAQAATTLFARATKDAVLSYDLATLNSLVDEIMAISDIKYVRICNQVQVLAEGGDVPATSPHTDKDQGISDVDDGIYDIHYPIVEAGTVYGSIEIGFSTSKLETLLTDAGKMFTSIAGLEVILVAVCSFVLGTALTRQLSRLKMAVDEITHNGPGMTLPSHTNNELGAVVRSFNTMSLTLAKNQQEIQDLLADKSRTLHELHRHEKIQQTILTASLDAIITINQSGYIVDYNTNAEHIFGWQKHEILHQDMAKYLIPQHLRSQHYQGMAHFIRTGEGPVLGQRIETLALHKNGHTFPVELAVSPVEVDGDYLFVSYIRDITARKVAEKEQLLAAQAFDAQEAIFFADESGQILRYNPTFQQLTGYDPASCSPLPCLSSLVSVHQTMWQTIHQGGKWSGELVLQPIRGEALPIYFSASPVFPDEHAVLYVCHFIDISEQKAHEATLQRARREAEKANEAKSRFLASMSHEIRTPMNGVLGILDILQGETLSAHQKSLVQTAHESGKHLVAIINDILDFSKMEANNLVLNHEPFHIQQVFHQVIELMTPLAEKHHLTLSLTLPPEANNFAQGDAGRIRQILLNLIHNAIKFTPQGGIRVEVSLTKTALNTKAGWLLNCHVIDSGIGIAPEAQESLFDEFTMSDQGYTRATEGTGLGLAICNRLIQLMGGELGLSSTLQTGSDFYFSIPLAIASQDATHPLSQKQLPILRAGMKILVTEDNAANRLVIGHMLKTAGIETDMVTSGEQAILAVQQRHYDLIFMDISMPGMDGMEATQRIRALSPENQSLPIIALTAHTLTGDRERFLSAGMTDYLSKPIHKAQLLDCLSKWVKPVSHSNERRCTVPCQSIDEAETFCANKDEIPLSLYPLVDPTTIHQLIEDTSFEDTDMLVELYLEDSQNRIATIRKAIEDNNPDQLQFETHALASSAGSYGNIRLSMLARRIEHLCIQNCKAHAIELGEQLLTVAEKSFLQLKALDIHNIVLKTGS